MPQPKPFLPEAAFAGNSGAPPRVFISPHRYIQGKDVIDRLGHYLSIISSRRPVVLLTEGGERRFGERIRASLNASGVEYSSEIFRGECSTEEVERIAGVLRNRQETPDAIIAVGGGKCLDAGKCVAFRTKTPVVICPTIASTDAPCSAVSVMYTRDGVGKGPEFFSNSPALVVVDSGIIAASPLRHLVAGIGDALATCYETHTCFRNPAGRNMLGTRITMAAVALSELCARTVFEHALPAIEVARQGRVNESLERIIEANTLLSGIGFESGGLAAAHAMAAGMTIISILHREFLHGELVAIGLIAHLILEGEWEEAHRVAHFMAEIGLPITLEQLHLNVQRDSESVLEAMKAALKEPFAVNEPFELTAEKLYSALLEAHQLGKKISG